jgi:hypothetical protein
MKQRRIERAALEGIELEYELRGVGEPVVLVHAGIFSDFFRPLVEEPALISRYCLVSYHRLTCWFPTNSRQVQSV